MDGYGVNQGLTRAFGENALRLDRQECRYTLSHEYVRASLDAQAFHSARPAWRSHGPTDCPHLWTERPTHSNSSPTSPGGLRRKTSNVFSSLVRKSLRIFPKATRLMRLLCPQMTANLRCSISGHSSEQNSEANSNCPVTARLSGLEKSPQRDRLIKRGIYSLLRESLS
jgi:hypothetical protein